MDRNLLLLSLASFFTDTASALVNSLLPLYLVFILHEGTDKLGVVVGVATFVSYLFRVLFGYLSDRWRKQKPFLLTGYTLSFLSKPLLGISHNWWEVALLKSLERLGKAIRTAPRDKFLSNLKGEKGTVFGIHKSFDVGGETLGTLLALAILYTLPPEAGTYRLAFLLTLPIGLPAVVAVLFLKEPKPAPRERELPSGVFPVNKIPLLVTLSLFPLFVWNEAFFLVEVRDKGFPDWFAPLLLLLTGLTQTLLGYPLGRLIDKLSPLKVFPLSLPIGGLAVFTLTQQRFALAFVLLGVALVTFFTSARSLIASQFGEIRGTAFGIFYALYAIFGAVGGVTVGFLLERYGEIAALTYTAVGIAVSLPLTVAILFSTFGRPIK